MRASKPPRLWLRPARGRRIASWIILDGGEHFATGCGEDDRREAEERLALHIAEKHHPKGARHPDRVPVADVIRLYSIDVAPHHARPKETAKRLADILDHWGERTLAAVNGAECRAFAKGFTPSAARKRLEDLRAALRHYHREGLVESVPGVVLPAKEQPRERWLTRAEAARLIWAAWRAREVQGEKPTRQWTGRHAARFMLVALYTGTRAGAVCAASWRQFDLEAGVFHRRPEGEAEQRNKRRPPVALPTRLLPHLRRWKALGGAHPVEWRGKPVARVSKAFALAAGRAKLKDVHPHVLRHTAATWLMQAGVDLWEAAGFLGMSVEVLRERYAHHHPDYQRRAAAAIGTKRKA